MTLVCAGCGRLVTLDDLDTAVWTAASETAARQLFHAACWVRWTRAQRPRPDRT